jgi:predicted Rossmann fold nucleotide-binding protein DprA/Smf involved in DNA uptake
MITARCANDEGRELFVIPHALTFEKGQGGNSILKRGEGKLIQTRQDLFDELPWLASDVGVASTGVAGIAGSAGTGVAGACTGVAGIAGSAALVGAGDSAHSLRRRWEECTMDEISRMICQCLSEVNKPMTLDHLSEVTGYSVHDVMIRLISLEMDQLIEQRPGNRIKLR